MGRTKRIQTYLDYLYSLDYKERPVSVDEFLNSPEFLGKLTHQGKSVRPIWRKVLNEVMADDTRWQVVFTGAIGTGKSRAAIWGVLYVLHRILCLRAPWEFFGGKSEGGKMTVAFFNLAKSQSQSKGYQILMNHLVESPWFLRHGTLSGSSTGTPTLHLPLIEFKLASPYSKGYGIQGDDIIAGILDELDAPDESEGQKKRVLNAYDSAVNRFRSRFVLEGKSLGRLFLVASKQETMSFLNTFVTERKNDESVKTVELALWEALPSSQFCGKTFNVMIGDIYVPSKIVETPEDVEKAQKEGRKIIQVPVEYLEDFRRDIVKALRDIAGISVTELRARKLFASETILQDCYAPERKNPVAQQTIEIGLHDEIDLCRFIDFSAIRLNPSIPRCIHWDISLSEDSTGIAMSGVCGWRAVYKENEGGTPLVIKHPVVETDFAMRIKAKEGDQIPFHRIRKLIIDLKKVYGFNINVVAADLNLLSADSRQTLTLAGFQTEYLSLDKHPELYRAFRDLVANRCWIAPYIPILHFELSNLEDDPVRNKVDHPDKVAQVIFLEDGTTRDVVLKGSKDVADAVVGSVMKAIELCKVPPDVEVMTNLIKKATTPASVSPTPIGNPEVLVNLPQQKTQEQEQIERSKTTFMKILRKAIEG